VIGICRLLGQFKRTSTKPVFQKHTHSLAESSFSTEHVWFFSFKNKGSREKVGTLNPKRSGSFECWTHTDADEPSREHIRRRKKKDGRIELDPTHLATNSILFFLSLVTNVSLKHFRRLNTDTSSARHCQRETRNRRASTPPPKMGRASFLEDEAYVNNTQL